MPRHLAIGIPRTILAHSSNTSWLAKCLGSLFVPSAGLGLSYLGWPFMAYGELCGARSNLYADKASLATLAFFVACHGDHAVEPRAFLWHVREGAHGRRRRLAVALACNAWGPQHAGDVHGNHEVRLFRVAP